MSNSTEEIKELSNYQKKKNNIMRWREKNRDKYLISLSINNRKYYELNKQKIIEQNSLYVKNKKLNASTEPIKKRGRPRKYVDEII